MLIAFLEQPLEFLLRESFCAFFFFLMLVYVFSPYAVPLE